METTVFELNLKLMNANKQYENLLTKHSELQSEIKLLKKESSNSSDETEEDSSTRPVVNRLVEYELSSVSSGTVDIQKYFNETDNTLTAEEVADIPTSYVYGSPSDPSSVVEPQRVHVAPSPAVDAASLISNLPPSNTSFEDLMDQCPYDTTATNDTDPKLPKSIFLYKQ